VRAKLTVLIPCKNEQQNIRACIDSVRSIADEILIADSGSTDATLDIVRDIGSCRVIQREYINPANFKNWAIPQASHQWVLIVDADERVTPELAKEIDQVLSQPSGEIDGFWIRRQNYFLGHRIRHCGWNRDKVLRLFRRDQGRYCDRWVHEEIQMDARRVGRLKKAFLHYTSWSTEDYIRKLNQYATWGAVDHQRAGRRPRLLPMFFRAPLRFAQVYFLRLGFLDGFPGLYVCTITAFYGFLKLARLWEMQHAIPQSEIDARWSFGTTPDHDPSAIPQPHTRPRAFVSSSVTKHA
jgi:glycosyltransferase involved in cell wall biosynthesis